MAINVEARSERVRPLPSPTRYPHAILTKPIQSPGIFILEFNNGENRLSVDFLQRTLRPALLDIEREYRASLAGILDEGIDDSGWRKPTSRGHFALVTIGDTRGRFYSNGLNFQEAFSTPYFAQEIFRPILLQLLTFPIPTVCAINGHAFAGGCMLALCHDVRVMREPDAKGRPYICMNEVEFGANIPVGTLTLINKKLGGNERAVRECVLEARRFDPITSRALGLVDEVVAPGDLLGAALRLAQAKAKTAQHGGLSLLKTGLYADIIKGFAIIETSATSSSDNTARLKVLGLSKL